MKLGCVFSAQFLFSFSVVPSKDASTKWTRFGCVFSASAAWFQANTVQEVNEALSCVLSTHEFTSVVPNLPIWPIIFITVGISRLSLKKSSGSEGIFNLLTRVSKR